MRSGTEYFASAHLDLQNQYLMYYYINSRDYPRLHNNGYDISGALNVLEYYYVLQNQITFWCLRQLKEVGDGEFCCCIHFTR